MRDISCVIRWHFIGLWDSILGCCFSAEQRKKSNLGCFPPTLLYFRTPFKEKLGRLSLSLERHHTPQSNVFLSKSRWVLRRLWRSGWVCHLSWGFIFKAAPLLFLSQVFGFILKPAQTFPKTSSSLATLWTSCQGMCIYTCVSLRHMASDDG